MTFFFQALHMCEDFFMKARLLRVLNWKINLPCITFFFKLRYYVIFFYKLQLLFLFLHIILVLQRSFHLFLQKIKNFIYLFCIEVKLFSHFNVTCQLFVPKQIYCLPNWIGPKALVETPIKSADPFSYIFLHFFDTTKHLLFAIKLISVNTILTLRRRFFRCAFYWFFIKRRCLA